jgi:rhamnose transport system substrate-binding protein
MITRRFLLAAGAAAPLAACSREPGAGGPIAVGLVAKSLGNGFFNAVKTGGESAAKELGVRLIFTGPPTTTAEGQIEVINALIAQRVGAIAVSANDPDALVPALKRAAQRGVKVVSYDSAVAPAGRLAHLAAASDRLIGETCVRLAADAAGGAGEIAILSATPTSTNQNTWIAEMKTALAARPELKLVSTVYGDDLSDKSYREAVTLLKQRPALKVIVAPTSVGIVAAAKAVQDEGAIGRVFVTGLGLPSEMAGAIKSGASKAFALWNPVDFGYAAVQIAAHAARGTMVGPDTSVEAGRLGAVTFDQSGVGFLGSPTVFDAANIDQFAAMF